jgi:hypothetical protein
MAIELGDISLEKITRVSVHEQGRIVRHQVPGLAGNFAQVLGRPSVEVCLEGVFFGSTAADDLGSLRGLYLAGDPVDFFADAVGDGYFAQVLVAGLDVEQRAGEPDQFSYTCRLIEYVEPPEPALIDPLSAIDTSLLEEAASFMDDVQNAIEQVSQLADLLANFPSFGDPTGRLGELPNAFTGLASGDALTVLTNVKNLF